jgi:hypothetical protein
MRGIRKMKDVMLLLSPPVPVQLQPELHFRQIAVIVRMKLRFCNACRFRPRP